MDCRAHNAEEQWFEQAKQKLVLGLFQPDIQVLDVDRHLLGLDEMQLIGILAAGCNNTETESVAAHEDIHHTLVSDARESLFLLDIITDVFTRILAQ
jgi:hypothetical protein